MTVIFSGPHKAERLLDQSSLSMSFPTKGPTCYGKYDLEPPGAASTATNEYG